MPTNQDTKEWHVNLQNTAKAEDVSSYNLDLANFLISNQYSTLGEIMKNLKSDQLDCLVNLVQEAANLDVKDKKITDFTLFTMLCMQAEGISLNAESISENSKYVMLGIMVESLNRKDLVEVDYKNFALSSGKDFVKIKGN